MINPEILTLVLLSISIVILVVILIGGSVFLKGQSEADEETDYENQFTVIQTLLDQQKEALKELVQKNMTFEAPLNKLNRYLSGGTLAGTFGEWGLEAIVSDILPANKFIRNCETVPGTGHRVEIAVKLTDTSLLPIDAKFPSALYDSYVEASAAGDAEAVEESITNIRTRIKDEAQKISEYYIAEEYTTKFGIMFIPSEGLMQLIDTIKMTDGITTLREYVSSENGIIMSGPNSMAIYLYSIDMGFRNVAVSKRAEDILDKFLEFDREFKKFVAAKVDVRKKINEINSKLDQEDRRLRVLKGSMQQLNDLSRSDEEATED